MADLRRRLPELSGRTCGALTVAVADEFSYRDPVDGSNTGGQGLRILHPHSLRGRTLATVDSRRRASVRTGRLVPSSGEFYDVIIDPRIAFGRAIISGTRVPTSVLFGQWTTEGSKKRVAKWFNVTQEAVATAIGFEFALAS